MTVRVRRESAPVANNGLVRECSSRHKDAADAVASLCALGPTQGRASLMSARGVVSWMTIGLEVDREAVIREVPGAAAMKPIRVCCRQRLN
jgi:hypothetical protein